jgi:hypothetical protein
VLFLLAGALEGLPSPLASVVFQACEDAPAATTADFTCTVTDASDDQGNVVDPSTLSFAATVPREKIKDPQRGIRPDLL